MGKRICLHEHKSVSLGEEGRAVETDYKLSNEAFEALKNVKTRSFHKGTNCFVISKEEDKDIYKISADYCIGMDWLGNTGHHMYVEPKINIGTIEAYAKALEEDPDKNDEEKEPEKAAEVVRELDYLRMLLDVMAQLEAAEEVSRLVQIDWDKKQIPVSHLEDRLTPFLVVQFLQLLRRIVRKGLRKAYYKVRENLTNRVKGKILVGAHLRQNVFKNRFTQTYCEYQVFGIDTPENRFLKKALRFAASYVENNGVLFGPETQHDLQHLVYYARPAFENVGDEVEVRDIRGVKHHPFFREYKEALQLGEAILCRFGYNLSQTAARGESNVPPFWIDMPRLFELYVYAKMLEQNPDKKSSIHYHLATYGNELDILVSDKENPIVIDAKYKLAYENGRVVHSDIRQVAGYARLNKVLDVLEHGNRALERDKVVPCLIIHPITEGEGDAELLRLENLLIEKGSTQALTAYHKVYRLGLKLPVQER